MTPAYDCIVLGVGGFGSAATYHASRRGARTLGLEQFTAVHDRGSSHGESRIIRRAYFEHPDYVPLVNEAYRRWAELEAATGGTLYTRARLLCARCTRGTGCCCRDRGRAVSSAVLVAPRGSIVWISAKCRSRKRAVDS